MEKAAKEQQSPRIFWHDARVRRLSLALAAALFLGLIIGGLQDQDASSALRRGDFPGLYSPAVIVARGEAERLFDQSLHHEIQREAWPSFGDDMYLSVYPPFFGIVLSPLGKLDPEIARAVWTSFSLCCFFLALSLLRTASKPLREHFLFFLVSSLLLPPVFFGVLGGQNTGLSLLLYVLGARLLERGTRWGDYLAGMCFGLWLFKPQFGVLAGAYLLLTRRWTALGGFALVACLYWAIAAALLGIGWVGAWIAATRSFAHINFEINSFQMASWAGLFDSLMRADLMSASAAGLLTTLAYVLTAVLLLLRRASSAWILGPAIVLLSPQTLFYDLSLSLISLLPFLAFERDRDVHAVFSSVIVLWGLFALRDLTPIAFPAVVAAVAFFFILRHSGRRKDESAHEPRHVATT